MNLNTIETYLDTINGTNKKIPIKTLDSWEYFGYPNKNIFQIDLELLIQTVYPEIKIVKSNSNARLSQSEFRDILIKKYSGKCVITQNDSLEELEAAHIVEIKDLGEYDSSNGLLLEANLHKTFDKYYWAINPDTMIIESDPKNKTKSIASYIGKQVSINLDPILYTNLKKRYEIFLSKSELN